ncbi:hypothetical protein Ocin01_01493 [Orchesella cincta]|uniref:Uncharacterized protein n=1 Tax=Orchesella cincta TaxID=48709 RepID=A0A1D2NIW0_ORCCI|nr:hypothetical protein Ocin01_01493 [Orchesella cincta]
MSKKYSRIFLLYLLEFVAVLASVSAIPLKQNDDLNDQNLSFEDKSYKKYAEDLLLNFQFKNYFAAIFQDETIRDDFTKYLNDGLTDQVKDDLAGLRIYKKVGDAEVPVVMFSSTMDNWLGILPQWKRTKRYFFKKIEEYLSSHPEVLNRFEHTVKP